VTTSSSTYNQTKVLLREVMLRQLLQLRCYLRKQDIMTKVLQSPIKAYFNADATMLQPYCRQIRLIQSNAKTRSRRHCLRQPLFLSALATLPKPRGAVLVLPGFLFSSKRYLGLANSLQQRGYQAEVVPVAAKEWWPNLLGGDFLWYLKRIDSALNELYNKHGSVAVVGHSAGGWVARILLGEDVPYQGRAFPGSRKKVHTLITLGTPHASIEAHPFGYIPEKLSLDADSVMCLERGCFKKKTSAVATMERAAKAAVAALEVPLVVRDSSLQFANYFYPDASCLSGVKVVCIAGDAITGAAPAWRDRNKLNKFLQKQDMTAAGVAVNFSKLDAWIAYEGYKSCCGNGAVSGDGVTPICIAHLPGAKNITLPGCWHGPKSTLPERPWYGDDVVLDQWVQYVDARYHDDIG